MSSFPHLKDLNEFQRDASSPASKKTNLAPELHNKLPHLKPKVYKDSSDPFKPPKFIVNPNKKEKKLITRQLKEMEIKEPDPPKVIDYGRFIDRNQKERLSLVEHLTSRDA